MLMTNQRQELRCQEAKLQGHSQNIYTRPQRYVITLYVIMFQIHCLTDERFKDRWLNFATETSYQFMFLFLDFF